ncbi:MAG: hypothetical protein MJB14_16040 [Spirochaetes bacterium]|nr:hypothetical protein [Spirochaetota bacterium]
MNFLSHYYLHADPKDNFFTVGLTLPDIIGIHSRKVRMNRRFINHMDKSHLSKHHHALLAGMLIHFEIDSWFHRTPFFLNHLTTLANQFHQITGKNITQFHAHILLEILVDRFLLVKNPDIAEHFYQSYKNLDFSETLPLFKEMKTFDVNKYLDFVSLFAHSTFLKEYLEFKKIPIFLERISKRVGFYIDQNLEDKKVIRFYQQTYHLLENEIVLLFQAAKSLGINKDTALKQL